MLDGSPLTPGRYRPGGGNAGDVNARPAVAPPPPAKVHNANTPNDGQKGLERDEDQRTINVVLICFLRDSKRNRFTFLQLLL